MKSERFVITDNVWEKIWRHTAGALYGIRNGGYSRRA